MRTRVKVCGFTDGADLQAALALGVDAIGLNLAKGPRKISLDQAVALRQLIPPGVSAIGLFVNADLFTMRQAIDQAQLDWVQLHGDEDPAIAKELMTHCRVLRACRVKDQASLQAASSYPCHALLLDAYVPGIEGGSGHGWNHQVLAGWQPPCPWILAGGLKPSSVAEALQSLPIERPWGIDCASGVESAPGRKDPQLISEMIAAVRKVDDA